MPYAYEFIRVTVRNRVGWLEYNRPPVNPLNKQLY